MADVRHLELMFGNSGPHTKSDLELLAKSFYTVIFKSTFLEFYSFSKI